MTDRAERIGVIGLGYVGLPLALALGRVHARKPGARIVGYDADYARIAELRAGCDRTREIAADHLIGSAVEFADDSAALDGLSVFIITVPTPVTAARTPDLGPLRDACAAIAPHLTSGALVALESTVYPGVTEEVCGPLLAELSGLRMGVDFSMGYSPERVNPGDAEHSLESVTKIISAQDPATLARMDAIYGEVIKAPLHHAPNIRVAEAAKVIENTQRDLNIALVNELAMIFGRLGIDTGDVLEAAGTKWNFLRFQPGLVGGHCIGVDPYYLTYKAQEAGYHPEVILAGRRINDRMGRHVAATLIKEMLRRGGAMTGARALILGFTFKENCGDVRNTRVADIVEELTSYGVAVDVHDPWAPASDVTAHYGVTLTETPEQGAYDAVILAVGHDEFRRLDTAAIRAYGRKGAVVYDLKRILPREAADLRL